MNFRSTARRTVAAAVAVVAPLALSSTAAFAQGADGTVSIAGVVWHDVDGDGVREAGEPPIANQWIVLDEGRQEAFTDASGRYRFTGLVPGAHIVQSVDRVMSGQVWSGKGTDFDPATGYSKMQYLLEDGQHVELDSGFVTADFDYHPTGISVTGPDKEVYEVGDVLDIVGGVTFDGLGYMNYFADLTLPSGVRKLERLGTMRTFMAEDKPNEVTGWFYDRKAPGVVETIGARVVVERPITAGEIRLHMSDGGDLNPANNTITRNLTAVAPSL
ncbi:SdrD B-like domain-containing protein [Saccharothrix coeruleofusca]|uniref:SD-repeat containing protein B domain-containing protein n=1 Tax=Saccharothrix coeruleofusca TaxID=33919 RepID=A0A918AJJ7_9PSEU|nr:SdrD B-like domain-containing protein [Saccharothrix coeruleofusca]GGP37142.1 hypothetical protein GCM10010185_05590 [Saccharothrix coeruleofusca]